MIDTSFPNLYYEKIPEYKLPLWAVKYVNNIDWQNKNFSNESKDLWDKFKTPNS